jgi:protein-tyrosine phosphatase
VTGEIPDRHVRLPGTRNLRDVGGYPAGHGRRTRWRTLLRTDALDRLPVASQVHLVELGIRQVIDLRWPSEVAEFPSVFAGSKTVRYRHLPLIVDTPPTNGPASVYRWIVDEHGAKLAGVARALIARDGVPAVIGCAAGIDRTGVTVALLLSAVGVPPEVVAADYAISAASYATDGGEAGLDDWRKGQVVVDCRPEYMIETLDHLARRHGGAAGLLARHGLDSAGVDRLGEVLTEPLDPPVDSGAARSSFG